MNQDEALHEAIAQRWHDLERAAGAAWPEIEPELASVLRALEAGGAVDARSRVEQLLSPLGEVWKEVQRLARKLRPRRSTGVPDLESFAPQPRVRYSVVPVHYGTDRAPSESAEPDDYFTGNRGQELQLGVVRVAIPDDHRMGNLERPRFWKLQFRQNPEKHVMLLDLSPMELEQFIASARSVAGDETGLVFVHGYNVGFAAAARRAAQIAYDLDFGGVPLLFSWPSEGKVLRYETDGGNAQWAEGHFRSFMRSCVADLGLTHVHVIAHSMGNRTLAEVFGSVDFLAGAEGASVGQIVFAAPDIDAERFKVLAGKFAQRARRFTLYASSRDKALAASELVHKYPRAGDPGAGPVIVGGVDTIDATGLDTDLMGHAYVGDNRSILSDVYSLMRTNSGPGDRFGLREEATAAGSYWRFAAD